MGIAFVLVAVILTYIIPEQETNFEEFALGPGTSSYFAHNDGYPVHLDNLYPDLVDSLMEGWHRRGEKDVILLLGNSQMHSVNQLASGQNNMCEILFDSLNGTKREVLAQSVPNANLQEMLYMFLFWKQRLPITELVVSVFFDDMREDGIRFSYMHEENKRVLLDETSDAAKEWNAEIGRDEAKSAGNNDNAALTHTVQERVEEKLDLLLAQSSTSWKNRPEMRGRLFTNLFYLRNRIFHIQPQSIRKLIPVLYEKNFSALQLLLESTDREHIPVLLYIPPIRSDVPMPYDTEQYAQFKERLLTLAQQYDHVTVKNFESIVAGEYWGVKESTTMGSGMEIDFMHFTYGGHKALAEALLKELTSTQ